ncbi:hypothetical protein U9M48_025169 [Paspalum notatum var. saurae]|uniref:Protein kinase domain-containing protein n=1 Tax=Paspalum notatum var. saurae TaxID=547442 RepID=A0AAQ3TQ76_PASNO
MPRHLLHRLLPASGRDDAPAYAWKVTEKSDVYSFGVVLLELGTGWPAMVAESSEDLVGWVSRRLESRDRAASLVDAWIAEGWAREEAVRVLRVAVLCTSRTASADRQERRILRIWLRRGFRLRGSRGGGRRQLEGNGEMG